MDLVIMAAGLGSRFGGLKQLEPIDNNGNFIIDYSIFDAIRAGFNKIVFVIKKDNLEIFRSTIGKRIEKYIDVEYAFQEKSSFVPKGYNIDARTKPWGTAHAILCAKNNCKGDFAVINADDFYGKSSILTIANFLKNNKNKNNFAMVGYKAINTVTENGEVKRGICNTNGNNLVSLAESVIILRENKTFARKINSNEEKEIDKNTLVSMNLFGFNASIFDYLEEGFKKFLEVNKADLQTCEYFIPTILTEYINQNKGSLKVLTTDDKWFGLTYKQDFDFVSKGIKSLVEKGDYPKNLWCK